MSGQSASFADAAKKQLHAFVANELESRGDTAVLSDRDSLFESGRLDSLAAVNLVEFLEAEFGLDFGEVGFGIEALDSIERIAALLQQWHERSAANLEPGRA